MEWQEAVTHWKQTMRSEYTRHSFGVAVGQFFKWSGEELEALSYDTLDSWVFHLADRTNEFPKLGRRITWTTFNKYLLALKLFLKYCIKREWIQQLTRDEVDDVLKKWPAQVTRPYLILDEEEIKRLMGAAKTLRNKCMLALGLFAGLRNFEICNLMAEDVGRDEQGCYVIVKGKGNKEASVPISRDVYELLDVYADLKEPGRLWDMTPEHMRDMVHAAIKRAGIEKNITPHSLRHTYAYRLFKKEVPVLVISKMLRHSNLAVTTGYLAHLSREETAQYAPSFPF